MTGLAKTREALEVYEDCPCDRCVGRMGAALSEVNRAEAVIQAARAAIENRPPNVKWSREALDLQAALAAFDKEQP